MLAWPLLAVVSVALAHALVRLWLHLWASRIDRQTAALLRHRRQVRGETALLTTPAGLRRYYDAGAN